MRSLPSHHSDPLLKFVWLLATSHLTIAFSTEEHGRAVWSSGQPLRLQATSDDLKLTSYFLQLYEDRIVTGPVKNNE